MNKLFSKIGEFLDSDFVVYHLMDYLVLGSMLVSLFLIGVRLFVLFCIH